MKTSAMFMNHCFYENSYKNVAAIAHNFYKAAAKMKKTKLLFFISNTVVSNAFCKDNHLNGMPCNSGPCTYCWAELSSYFARSTETYDIQFKRQ